MKYLVAVAIFLLPGCAVSDFGRASSGGAVYEYVNIKADGSSCTLRITSARNVTGGDIQIGENCELISKADDAGGAVNALQEISEITNRVLGP